MLFAAVHESVHATYQPVICSGAQFNRSGFAFQYLRNCALLSVDLNAELFDNRCPERDIFFEPLPEFFRGRIAADLEA